MTIEESLYMQLGRTAEILERYGFKFWADKLRVIRQSGAEKPQGELLIEISKLYGGFGTLMDLAVDPYLLPDGTSEDDANRELLHSINQLYEYVKNH